MKRLWGVGLLQALGLVGYIAIVATVFWRGNEWFPKMSPYWGPVLVLTLLSVSVLISGLITLGYPFLLFWEKKKTKEALRLVVYTAVWLAVFVLASFSALYLIRLG